MEKKTNEDTGRAQALRFKVPQSLIRKLTIDSYPKVDAKGNVTGTIPNPNTDSKGRPQAYEFMDDTQGAPTGFGIFVGARGASFQVRRRFESRFIKFVVGKVNDMTLVEAHDLARAMWADVVASEGRTPKKVQQDKRAQRAMKSATVADAFARYIEHLKTRSERAKEVSLDAVNDSLERLSRPEVGLAEMEIRQLSREVLLKAWIAVRTEAMKRSPYVSAELKQRLLDPEAICEAIGVEKPWYELSEEDLERMGVKGKVNARVRSAGMSATEHTFSDASRGVRLLIKDELRASAREDRKAELRVNPFDELEDNFRSQRALNIHYKDAEVRNPLLKGDKSLSNVLKAIVARRLEQGGLNKTASDYLLLTLLWGARRNETAPLAWYEACDPKKLEKISWVWLAENAKAINPITKKPGSQVYFHDTKNGYSHLIPICYFAERILQQRRWERNELLATCPPRMAHALRELEIMKTKTKDHHKLASYEIKYTREVTREYNLRNFVFPARSTKADKGYYSDSKSILRGIRTDAGLLDLSREIDIGLTPHDFRRTLGSFAGNLLQGPITSKLLNHKVKQEADVSPVDAIYTEQEWSILRDGLSVVEEALIKESPRVWNLLKGADKEVMDEVNDLPIALFQEKRIAEIMEGKVGFDGKTVGSSEGERDE